MKRIRKGKVKAHVRLKRELTEAAKARQEADLQHRTEKAELERRLANGERELKASKDTLISKNETINTYQREQQVLLDKFQAKEAELKRVDRLVDQFLSVQIVSHDKQIMASTLNQDTPRSLRRT